MLQDNRTAPDDGRAFRIEKFMAILALLLPWILLLTASAIAGALNGIAGGGSFISFPALIFAGLPPINANATNNTGTWVGYLASLYAYRRDFGVRSPELWRLVCISLAGGVIGSLLLLKTPQAVFAKLVPYLLLVATLLFAFNPLLKRLQRRRSHPVRRSKLALAGLSALQLAIAIYGGFFGGGVGILLLALFGLMGMEDIHAMNALKTILSACINGIAMATFIVSGAVLWPHAIVMSIGTLVGGYWGVYYVRKADPKWVRRFVISIGLGMTVYFFIETR
ncbi:sulfite exporter TauE/SafE family protein [Altericista sp. CCNU0014]|uniref:sulfite exporter TauE/SafE family protein n=1 Tax=Altericista sp. CCNU0014 TaxID=3082949 RepID=UPI00384F5872